MSRPARPGPRSERDFVLEDDGSGRAADLGEKTLARLRRGLPAPEFELDLHGLDAREAARLVQRELEQARADGVRCVRIVHGRGLHSASGPVLREQLPRWLTAGPLADAVLAFTRSPALRDAGGSTLVLLRRSGRGRAEAGRSGHAD